MARADVDRNLHFGLIALRISLVDQDRLVEALQRWSRDEDRPLAEHLLA